MLFRCTYCEPADEYGKLLVMFVRSDGVGEAQIIVADSPNTRYEVGSLYRFTTELVVE